VPTIDGIPQGLDSRQYPCLDCRESDTDFHAIGTPSCESRCVLDWSGW
jgi:hypothetical protein